MKLLTENQIRSEIRAIRPNKIAVAYIGKDWAEFIDPDYIEQIIVSPRIGSNPVAIKALVRHLGGWERVFFLDELHSKIYLKYNDIEHSVIIGSANLSRNALDIGGLIETCILTNDTEITAQANGLYNEYIEAAKKQYATDNAKEVRLQKLLETYPITSKGKATTIDEFEYNSEKPIHLSWYIGDTDEEYDYDRIRLLCPELACLTDDEIDFQIELGEHHFLPIDQFNTGNWILVYRLNEDLQFLGKNNKLEWLYIHELIPDCFEDPNTEYKYTQLAIQLRSRYVPEPPFVIDNRLKTAFRTVLNTERFHDLRPNNGNVNSFSVSQNIGQMPDFFRALREEYLRPT